MPRNTKNEKSELKGRLAVITLIIVTLLHAILTFFQSYPQFVGDFANLAFVLPQAGHVILLLIGGVVALKFFSLYGKLSKANVWLAAKAEGQFQQLKKKEAEEAATLSSVGDGLIILNEDYSINFANAAAEKMLGWKREEMVGKYFWDMAPMEDENGKLIPKKDRPCVKNKRNTQPARVTGYFIRKDLSRLPITLTIAPIILKGKWCGQVETFIDTTREKSAERIKNEFLSLAAHQLRTPLSATKWLIDSLMEKEDLDARQKEKLEDLRASNERLIFIVNDLLNIAKIESDGFIPSLNPVSLENIIKKAAGDLKEAAESQDKKIELDLKGMPDKLYLDEFKFNGAFRNILENAVNYSYPKTTIAISGKPEGGRYVIAVRDFGLVIPESEKEHICDKFYRSESAKKIKTAGSGLGLFIAKKIIESHEGKIWFESSEEKGTTFFISLQLPNKIS